MKDLSAERMRTEAQRRLAEEAAAALKAAREIAQWQDDDYQKEFDRKEKADSWMKDSERVRLVGPTRG